MLQSSRI